MTQNNSAAPSSTNLLLHPKSVREGSQTGKDGHAKAGDSVIYDNAAKLPDGTIVAVKVTVEKLSNENLRVDLTNPVENQVFLINGDRNDHMEGESVKLRFDFMDQETGKPVELAGKATFTDIDENSGAEQVILDRNDFTAVALDKDSSLKVSVNEGEVIIATGTEPNNPSDQDAWFQAQFDTTETISVSLVAPKVGAGYGFNGADLKNPVITEIVPIYGGKDDCPDGNCPETIEWKAPEDYKGNGAVYHASGKGKTPFSIEGTPEEDRLQGAAGNDTIKALGSNDWVFGGDGDDWLYGDAGDDTVKGGEGNDKLSGGEGDDTLIGNEGNDIFYGQGGNDKMFGNDGIDWMYGGDGNDLVHGADGQDYLSGANGNDTLRGGADNDTLGGEAGNDALEGGSGDDQAYGGDGNDAINGGHGNDTLDGGNGNDKIKGSNGADKIYGGAGNDTAHGGVGQDVIYGNGGRDKLFGGNGDDAVHGGNGADLVCGNAGNDKLAGGAGNDKMFGGTGNDYMDGGTGNDLMVGGLGNDTMKGGNGADRLVQLGKANGTGEDVLTGGAGADHFDFCWNKDEGSYIDLTTVTDFNQKEDKLSFAAKEKTYLAEVQFDDFNGDGVKDTLLSFKNASTDKDVGDVLLLSIALEEAEAMVGEGFNHDHPMIF
ncbi:calcium-binding protein [Pseudaestuariivita sp.]|uniref:calcium-binding protein n=1 Tax=Pseudaestuariivita sp. TaxID=2211669 RepID=UPI004058FB63